MSITIPVSRGFDVAQGRRLYHFEPGQGHVAARYRGVQYRPETGSSLVALNLDNALLVAHAAEPGMSREEVLDWLPVQLDLRKCAGAGFMRAFESVLEGLPETMRSSAWPSFSSEVESELAALLIEACRGQAGAPSSDKIPLVRGDRAEEFLRASLTEPVSLADVAAAAGISVRTLTRTFAHRYGMGPMRFLRNLRLDAVRRALLAARPGELGVTEVALRHGFTHFGRFAGQYRERFGEAPSHTLKHRSRPGRRAA
jgi:AraC-like DNA-binding protein